MVTYTQPNWFAAGFCLATALHAGTTGRWWVVLLLVGLALVNTAWALSAEARTRT